MSIYQLSIEEVGFIMGYLGDREAAAGYLVGLIGQQNNENLAGRIVAASHSLVARGILKVGAVATETSLEPSVSTLVQAMVSATSSLRCEKLYGQKDTLLTLFLGREKRVAHSISSEVIANIEDVTKIDLAIKKVTDFIGAPTQGGESPLGKIPLTALEAIRNQLDHANESTIANLFSHHIPSSTAHEVALSLKDESIEWGSVMRLDTADKNADTPLEANSGILYAKSAHTLWLFHIEPSNRYTANRDTVSPDTVSPDVEVTIYRGSQPLIDRLTKPLLALS